MYIILLLFILLYIAREGQDLLRHKSWKEALLGTTIIAISLVYGIDYIREGQALPHPGLLFEKLQPVVDAYFAFFKLPR